MPARTTTFSALLAPGLHKVFQFWMKQRPPVYREFLNVETSDRNYEEELPVSGVGGVVAKAEGSGVTYSEPVQGTARRYTHQGYGLGFRVTREMRDDDLYNVMNRMPKALSKSMGSRVNVDSFSVLNSGFDTTITTYDALSLFNTAHTLLRGGTQANRPTTEADLSLTSLQAAIETFRLWTDEDGHRADLYPKMLIVPVQSRWLASELLESELKPGTANNEINALVDQGIKWMDSPYITDTDSWFMLSDKSDHRLMWWWRTQPEFENSDDFDSGDAKYKIFARYAFGATHPWGAYGTQGI